MELTYDQMDFIRIALEAHIASLKKDMEALNEPLVTETIQGRIDKMQYVINALESGDYALTLERY